MLVADTSSSSSLFLFEHGYCLYNLKQFDQVITLLKDAPKEDFRLQELIAQSVHPLLYCS